MSYIDDHEQHVTCGRNHDHWGRYGAAGLLLRHVDEQGTPRFLMTLRSPHVMSGNTWSIPGGARMKYEPPEAAAHREAHEELGPFQTQNVQHLHTNDHGGWAYHTVGADAPERFETSDLGWETDDTGWLHTREIDDLPLHPGFRESWNALRPQPPHPRSVWGRKAERPDV